MNDNYLTNAGNMLGKFFAGALVIGMSMYTSAPSYASDAFTKVTNENEVDQSFAVTGKITDEAGEPLIGVTIIKEGSTYGVVSSYDGTFALEASKGDIFTASYLGFTSQSFTIDTKTVYGITLVADALAVDEVVVVGFGTQKKVNVTGAVSMIEGDAIEARPTKDVSSALQGLIPGLNFTVSSSGGEVASEMNFNIRGTGTIDDNSSDSPLVLIDGVEGNMNTVNPNDIASISVLKDAASASIYGSRAAFGVILITTKEGTSGKAKINYSSNFRFNSPINLPHTVDSYTYAQVMNIASNNDGSGDTYDTDTVERILAYQNGTLKTTGVVDSDGTSWKNYQYTNANSDWHDYFYRSMVMSHDQNLSITGGSDNFDYYVSAQYTKQNGILVYEDQESMKRYNLTGRINAKLTDWLKLTYTSKWNRTNYDQPTYLTYNSGNFYHSINSAKPNSPIYDDNGYLSGTTVYSKMVEGGDTTKETDININQIRLVATPLKGWNITAEGSMKITNYHTHQEILPVYDYDATGTPQEVEFIGGSTAAGYSQIVENAYSTDFYTFNLFSDYTKEYKGHTFKILGGFNTEYYDYRNMKITAQDLVTPNLPTINTSNSFVESGIAAGYKTWATAGFFGRLNYDYKGKYLLELNARYDGTSRFIEDVRWAVFPSASLGWNIAKEDFFEPLKDVVSTLKLRASWGQLGNTNTSSFYPFYATMSTGLSNSGWMYDGAKQNTAAAPDLISTSLTWETVTSYEVGLDFAMFNNRLTGGGGYFERITSDMIGPADDLPLTLGTDVPDTNNAEMKSYGWELELAWRDKIGDFKYGIRGTIYDAQQEITKYNNFTNSISTWYAGKKVGEIWGYETVGIAQTDAEMQAHLDASKQTALGSNFGAGDIMYRDIDGDGEVSTGEGTLEDSGDYRVIGNSTSRYCFGISMDFSYKWFDLSMYWQGVGKRDYSVGTSTQQYYFGVWNNFQQSMCFDEHMDFWRDETSPLGANYDAYYAAPTFTSYAQNQKVQTRYLENAAYVRLKNLQLGYSLSEANLEKIGVSSLRIYFSADNLLTFSPMADFFDPEALSGSGGIGKIYPLSRTLSLGVNINF